LDDDGKKKKECEEMTRGQRGRRKLKERRAKLQNDGLSRKIQKPRKKRDAMA